MRGGNVIMEMELLDKDIESVFDSERDLIEGATSCWV